MQYKLGVVGPAQRRGMLTVCPRITRVRRAPTVLGVVAFDSVHACDACRIGLSL
jgi:hypothetical protein